MPEACRWQCPQHPRPQRHTHEQSRTSNVTAAYVDITRPFNSSYFSALEQLWLSNCELPRCITAPSPCLVYQQRTAHVTRASLSCDLDSVTTVTTPYREYMQRWASYATRVATRADASSGNLPICCMQLPCTWSSSTCTASFCRSCFAHVAKTYT